MMNCKFLFSYTLLFVFAKALAAQGTPTGLILDDDQYEAIEPLALPEDTLRGMEFSYEQNLQKYCPTAGNQGNIASCVGWSLAYALTIERAIQNGITDRKVLDRSVYSASFIYNQIKAGDCFAGAKLTDGLLLLRDLGDCLEADFVNSGKDCSTLPSLTHKQKAAKNVIYGYRKVYNPDLSPDGRIDWLRYVLDVKQKPVLLGLNVPHKFQTAPLSQLDWSQAPYAHAVIIVGYHDGRGEFLILNSYGPEWGEDGYFWLDYDTFAAVAIYGFILETNEN